MHPDTQGLCYLGEVQAQNSHIWSLLGRNNTLTFPMGTLKEKVADVKFRHKENTVKFGKILGKVGSTQNLLGLDEETTCDAWYQRRRRTGVS